MTDNVLLLNFNVLLRLSIAGWSIYAKINAMKNGDITSETK